MASLARPSYRDVFVGSVEDFRSPNQRSYDRILFLDIPEHLPELTEPSRLRATPTLRGTSALIDLLGVSNRAN
jgi:hypothetical protein